MTPWSTWMAYFFLNRDNLVGQMQRHLVPEGFFRLFLDCAEDFIGVFVQFPDGEGVGGVEGEGDHRLDSREVNLDQPVVVGGGAGTELFIAVPVAVNFVIFADGVVGFPDGGEAGGLGRHDVDAQPEIGRQAFQPRARKLEDPVGDKPLFKDSAAEGDGDVVGADAVAGSAG